MASYIHLELAERALIETQLRLGMRPAAIAAGLMRARSTVLREIRRNGWLSEAEISGRGKSRVAGGYRCVPADRRAPVLAHRPRVLRKLVAGNRLWGMVIERLRRGLSPAQIARTLARMPEPVRLSYETIYTALYAMPRGELRSSLLWLMRRGHHARRPQRGRRGPLKPPIPDMVLIDQRPVEVEMRLVPGHWEGDLIIGKNNRSQVGTLVERTTLFVALVKLDSSRADLTAEAFTKVLNRFDSQLRRSLGARHLRKHQRPAAPVPAQGHRPVAVLAGTTRRYRMAAQHPAQKNPGMEGTRRTLPPRRRLRLRATLVSDNTRCTWILNPPTRASVVG
jgi:transposase, IS30 family